MIANYRALGHRSRRESYSWRRALVYDNFGNADKILFAESIPLADMLKPFRKWKRGIRSSWKDIDIEACIQLVYIVILESVISDQTPFAVIWGLPVAHQSSLH